MDRLYIERPSLKSEAVTVSCVPESFHKRALKMHSILADGNYTQTKLIRILIVIPLKS